MSITTDIPVVPPAEDLDGEDDIVTIHCTRCIVETAYWESLRKFVASSVEDHVDRYHMPPNGVGSARPNGRPVWVEGEDWWVVDDDIGDEADDA